MNFFKKLQFSILAALLIINTSNAMFRQTICCNNKTIDSLLIRLYSYAKQNQQPPVMQSFGGRPGHFVDTKMHKNAQQHTPRADEMRAATKTENSAK